MYRDVSEKVIPSLIEQFLILIDAINSPLANDHLLAPLIKVYQEWDKTPILRNMPDEVLKLADVSASIFEFSNDWQSPATKAWMINRIRKNDQVRGILFEFRAAVHFRIFHPKVQWLSSEDGMKKPDIQVVTAAGVTVYVECTRKMENSKRSSDSERLIRDILLTLFGKMKQRQGFASPLQLAIYIPEECHWLCDELNTRLGKSISKRLEDPIYGVLSAVTVVSNRLPTFGREKDGRMYCDTHLDAITYKNHRARNPFPADFVYQFSGNSIK